MKQIRKIVVTGGKGFIGSSIVSYLVDKGHYVTSIDINCGENVILCDVSDEHALAKLLINEKPEIIIHCAAIKNLPVCEKDRAKSLLTNVLSTEVIASYAASHNAKIVYLSSDVVFNGEKGNYTPSEDTNPINWYGNTKVFSEHIVRDVPRSAICRTALVIGALNETYKIELAKELKMDLLVNQTLLPQYIYHRLKNNMALRMPTGIISNPTPIELLCDMVGRIIDKDARGIFHTTGPDAISRYETADLIARLFDLDKRLIVKDDENISPLRPKNVSMDSRATFEKLDIDTEDWRLAKYLVKVDLYA